MKTSETGAVVSLIFTLCSAILTGNYEHITDNPVFGCRWIGGISPGVVCLCRDDAEEMYITKKSISSYDTSSIEIHCKSVRFGPESITEMRNLRNIKLKSIQSLNFDEHSLKWYGYRDIDHHDEPYDISTPSLQIEIENSTIGTISSYTFEGRINKIRFDGVTVQNLSPFAFNSLRQTQEIVLRNVELLNAREQAFKKFSTDNFELNGVKSTIITSRFVFNVTVYNSFKVTNCVFDTVRPGGFIVFNPRNFQVSDTTINHLDAEAFKVTTRGDVLFRSNKFNVINDGAFLGIDLNPDETAIEATMSFDSNVFTKLTRDSLTVNENFRPKFANLFINETCDCTSIDHNIKDTEFYSEIKCWHEREFVTVKEFKTNKCSIIQSYSTVIVIVVVVFTLCVIIGTVLVVYYRRVYLSKKYGSEKGTKNGNLSMIVPDGRTYRETELHVIVERADLLTTDL
ncbi:uncharacterized protein LOC103312213 [Tribolium castaneum]|uniref:Uncharacterized protein n=1 Tax=Tribolium castaneum TaxID=7070 RepID=D6WED6_TRICA|nr:PREDICTED: uncharacterized protein LOC103312213 [Tribolium castaneum]XP_008190533.1 PREDICTED: uncharacterized protein LOC103312213 [Tribolium castaneum]XP_008190535.1 PREDICTED: uncharacterized protein LOC103312213 [Tribolium castaneum]XP_008190536.1 PREDICTED: uncharacterized protein LOC103312213 [Tribolium castaneum]XP_008190537.1 PREDICTED: uncharacterized protein LOC103312213 [Tribolium castaneum]XP_015833013.1 PREDICTED: uncharacterized protein LOC103312213 [Tribolium castaneum]EFA00|eukprot:XP_008190532.1 PREDICTED: uncharacterized protein LOC103312213 [Tribolium castaneum]